MVDKDEKFYIGTTRFTNSTYSENMEIFTVMTLVGVFVFKNKITPVRMLGLFFAFAVLGCMVISNIYGV